MTNNIFKTTIFRDSGEEEYNRKNFMKNDIIDGH